MLQLGTRLFLTAVVALGTTSGSPSFTQVPGDLSYTKGQDVVFNWAFEFEAPLDVSFLTWYKISDQGPVLIMSFADSLRVRDPYMGRVELVGQAGLKLLNISESDAGPYEMEVLFTDKTEIANRSILDVKYAPVDTAIVVPPSHQPSPGNALANLGDDLALECTARSNPAPRFSWTKDRLPTTDEEVDQTTGLLTIRSVQKRDTGTYRCHASNGIQPQGTDSINVVVHYPPTFATARIVSPLPVKEGDNLTIVCSCDNAFPTPRFRWAKNGSDTLPDSAVVDEQLGRLTIGSVQLKDSGVYICVAGNGVPPSPSDEVTVEVTAKPTVRPAPTPTPTKTNYTIVIVATVCPCCLIFLVCILFCFFRRRRSVHRRKSDKVLASFDDVNHHRERLEYLCPDQNVLRVSNATELDKMADPVLQEFWDCLVRMDVDPVLVFLRENRSLAVDEVAGIRAAPCVVERLLDILCVLKGDQASRVLSDALRHSDQTHLADLLDGKVLPDARCVTMTTVTETSFGLTFRPAYKNLQHFGDVDKYLVTLELALPEPKPTFR
ncbi:PREDICTED: hemicentin-2-like [Branchiostoma belcheri]|uniref:Hemicentin-2-like n=1 Tax=Branchiostoma belcheri TaxID=7741 RepID=A0A6P4ZVM9_BRABE|nr:PREDICTED: hemicentin-2-like [Branchiostoma belcheri]